MSTNPMQRQAKNYFLLGILLGLIVVVIVGALLIMHIRKLNAKIDEYEAQTKTVYVANQEIKSGQTITSDMFTLKTVKSDVIPADATSDIISLLSAYSLCDKSGNNIYTDSDGSLYMLSNDVKVKVYQDETTGEYYTQSTNEGKKYIETTEKALLAKVNMKANTVITSSLVARSNEVESDDVRIQEYNVIVLPADLTTGDYVDVRLMLPTGEDFIVISKKQVTVPMIGTEYSADTIQMNLGEDDILTMSCAIVEAFQIDGAKLYATKYTDAGNQEAATPTYVVNANVYEMIKADPNITSKAREGLYARYTQGLTTIRNNQINGALSTNGDSSGAASGIESSITTTKEERQKYLDALSGK